MIIWQLIHPAVLNGRERYFANMYELKTEVRRIKMFYLTHKVPRDRRAPFEVYEITLPGARETVVRMFNHLDPVIARRKRS